MSGHHFRHNGTDLFYSLEGSGAPILFIHGWGCDQNDWSFQVPFLLALGYLLIGFDLRGHGHSSAYSIDGDHRCNLTHFDPVTMANDAAALLEHLGVNASAPAIVLGHSLGGIVANELVFRRPELVRGTVLVDPAYYIPPDVLANVSGLFQENPASALDIATNFWAEAGMYPTDGRTPTWLEPYQRRRAWATPPHTIAETWVQMAAYLGPLGGAEYLRRTKKGGVPRLVTPAANESAELEREVNFDEKFETIEVIPAGHFLFMVDPERFNAVLKTWLTNWGFMS